MSEAFLMGLDLGGSGIRCLLVAPDGGRTVTASRPWAPRRSETVALGSEYDPEATWRELASVVREALARAGAGTDAVLGIAASSMRHGSALLDANGQELLLAPNRDARGTGPAFQLSASRGAELHRRTGHWPNAVQPGTRLRWFVTEAPDVLARASTHLSLNDWIAFRLCGERATDPSQASETLLLGIERPEWDAELADSLEIPRQLLPPVHSGGTPLGVLTPEAADALGLAAGVPVAVGGADTQCGLLGAGVTEPGQLGVVAGSSAPVLQVTAGATLDDDGRLWAVHHVVPARWGLESNGGGLGEALEWFARLVYPGEAFPISCLMAEAARSPAGAAGLLSSLGAEVMDARVMGLPVGNLTLNYMTSAGDPEARRHLARAMVEGQACGLRANAEQVERATGVVSDTLRVTGGVSRAPLFTQVLSDVLGRPVEVSGLSDATSLGAALCGGVGAGVFADLAEGAAVLARTERRHEPRPEVRSFYEDHFAGWQEVREARKTSDARAAGFAMTALGGALGEDSTAEVTFRPKILVTADLDEEGLAALRELGDVEYASYREKMRLLTGPALAEALAGVHALVTEVDVIDAPALLQARDLRAIAVCRGDAVNVDLEACTALGIPVVNTPGRNADAVADLAVAYMLMLARRLAPANAFLREPGGEAGDMGRMGRAFGTLRGNELWRKTVGLVGLGAVGRKVVQRVRPFGVRCLAYDPYQDPESVRAAGAEPVELEALLEESDFVTLHAVVTDASRGLLGRDQLARMKPGAFVINTARAALLDEDALVDALQEGKLGGAALDVFAVEPPGPDDPLLALGNVVATPHVGGNTHEVAIHQGRIVAAELGRLLRGDPPRHALNPEALEGFRFDAPRKEPSPALAERLGKGAAPAVTDLERDEKKPAQGQRKTAVASVRPAASATRRQPPPGLEGGEVQKIRENMERLFERFLEACRSDESFARFAASAQDVTLHFTLKDLGMQMHLGFSGGEVIAEMGPPAGGDDVVQLKMPADLFDGMLTGRRNAMQAAMDGELSFSGDTAKAMTLQQINPDMSRLYRAAREELGDPGDLASLPGPDTGASAAAAPGAVAAGDGDERHELCRIVDELYAAQLITATGGNVSVRRSGHDDEAWITPSQLFKGDLAPEILVRIGMNGKALDENARSPSSEAIMHTAVLQAKAEAQAVIHCHAPNATVLVNSGLPFLPISTEAAFFQKIGRIPFVMPGTQALANAIVEAMGDGWAVLMQNHGLLVAGRTLRRAADMAEIIERTCEVILGGYAVGKEPPVLPDDVVEMLGQYGDLMA
jgi:autoinducer 2 (AI-2) kinase